jgi:hypothetical protein
MDAPVYVPAFCLPQLISMADDSPLNRWMQKMTQPKATCERMKAEDRIDLIDRIYLIDCECVNAEQQPRREAT